MKQCGHISSIDFLIEECCVDVNLAAEDQFRALHLAAKEGHPEALQRLLTLGADPSLPDRHGRTGN